MRHLKPRLPALMLCILLTACGSPLLTAFQAELKAGAPLVNSLVAAGELWPAKAQLIIKDLDDGAECGRMLQERFDAIPKTLPANEIKLRKSEAAGQARQCFTAIIARQNFAAHPRILKAVLIADGILASIEVFYSSNPNAARHAGMATARDEKDLEKKLRIKVEELKKAMQP